MRRRDFMLQIGSAALAWPLATLAQQPPRAWRIGFLSPRREEPSAFRYYEPTPSRVERARVSALF